MTPLLTLYFGNIYAKLCSISEQGETITRISEIYQYGNSTPLLEAKLLIQKTKLPQSFLQELIDTPKLFGQLLIEYGIDSEIRNRVRFSEGEIDQSNFRWGRRHTMIESSSGHEICRIQELLATEEVLLVARGQASIAKSYPAGELAG